MVANHFEEQEDEVLGDAFHVMDRIKVSMHHDFKPSFFRAIRGSELLLKDLVMEAVSNDKSLGAMTVNDEYRNPVSARDVPIPRTSTTANITELGIMQQIQRKKRKKLCDTPGCVEKYGDSCPKKN